MDKIQKFLSKILPIYWAFLTFILLRPKLEKTPSVFLFKGFDKVAHFIVFMILGFLFWVKFPKQKFSKFIIIMFLYGLLTEILQGVMGLGRSFDVLDLFADMLGVLLGYFISKMIGFN